MSPDLRDRLAFLTATDALKHTLRANRVIDGSRQENVAEHTWQVALLSILFADAAPSGTDLDHVRQLLIVHDLVEVYAGDTAIWDEVSPNATTERELAAATRLFDLLPESSRGAFEQLWREFEAQSTVEARFARALDALHPMLMSWGPDGIGHPRLELTPQRVLDRKRVDIKEFPELWDLAQWLVSSAVERGLIVASD